MPGPHPPWTLAFELSNPTSAPAAGPGGTDASSLALGRGGSLIAAERVAPAAPRSETDDLFPALARLFARAGISPRELGGGGGRIAVSVGPGGYTGLRVACAAAATLAEAVGARCVSVPTALVALIESDLQTGDGTRAVALASKADSAWVYIEHQPDPTAPRFITAATAAAYLAGHSVAALIADSFIPAPIRAACEAAGIRIIPPQLSAAACLRASAMLPDIDPAQLVPIYAREPDAVTQWRERAAQRAQS